MLYKIKQFFRNIHNIYRWFPIIWKDRDWDDHFIWEILKFKLTNQAKYIGHHNRHTSAKRDAQIMNTCVKLIDKIQNEYYNSEYIDYHNNRFHFDDCKDKPGYKQLRIEEVSERYDDYFKLYPRIYKQVINSDKLIFNKKNRAGIAMNIAHINHDRARKLLFKIIEQNIERWWD
jgi:hypothetical protein